MGLFSSTYVHKEAVPYEKRVVYEGVSANKAAALYKEFRDKAESDLRETVKLESNTLKAQAWVYDDLMTGGKEAVCAFKLNGEEHVFRAKLPRPHESTAHEAKVALLNGIREIIAHELLKVFAHEA